MATIAASAHVTSTSSAQSKLFSYVFFVQPDRQVGYLKGPLTLKKQDPQDAKPYKVYSVSLRANNVSAHQDSTQVTSVIYEYQGVTKIRVYYINTSGELAELCSDEDEDGPIKWSDGSLNDGGFVADPKTMLTASVDFSGQGQLKLFYQKKLNGFLQCAYVTTGKSAWNQAEINQAWDF